MWRCFLFAYCFIVVNIVLFGGLKCLRLSVRKVFVLLSNALKSHLRRSNGKRKVVSGLARNLIGSKIASATAKKRRGEQ